MIYFRLCRHNINITVKIINRQITKNTRHVMCCCDIITLFRRRCRKIKRADVTFFSNQFKILFTSDKKYCKHNDIMYILLGEEIQLQTIVQTHLCCVICKFADVARYLLSWALQVNYFSYILCNNENFF